MDFPWDFHSTPPSNGENISIYTYAIAAMTGEVTLYVCKLRHSHIGCIHHLYRPQYVWDSVVKYTLTMSFIDMSSFCLYHLLTFI